MIKLAQRKGVIFLKKEWDRHHRSWASPSLLAGWAWFRLMQWQYTCYFIMSLKLLTGKLKSVMHDGSHSREANDQQDPNNSLSYFNKKRKYASHTSLYTMGLATIVSIQIL
jgi:hypothetical protein